MVWEIFWRRTSRDVGGNLFTKNGVWLGKAFKTTTVETPLFPTVGIHSNGNVVKVNLGTNKFVFDIKSYISTENKKCAVQVTTENTSQLLTHELVRDLCFSHGYSLTQAALDSECCAISTSPYRVVSIANTVAEGLSVDLRAKLRLFMSLSGRS